MQTSVHTCVLKTEPLEDKVKGYCLCRGGSWVEQLTFTIGTGARRGTCVFMVGLGVLGRGGYQSDS